MANEKIIWDFLIKQGFNAYGVAGLMGNLYAESGLVPNNLENTYSKKFNLTDDEYTKKVDNGTYTNFVKDSAGYGLAQWTYWTRKQNLLNFAKQKKRSIGNLTMQLEFLVKELKENFPSVYNVLKTATSVKQASDAVLMDFERPANASAQKTKRANLGMNYYNNYAKGANNSMSEKTCQKGKATQLSANFKSTEFDCHGNKCCSTTIIDLELIKFLQKIRDHFGTTVTINSGYRCPTHNKNIGGASQSYHMQGKAADIVVKGYAPKEVAQYAESLGMKGIGVYKTFTHVDTRPSKYYWYDGGASNVSTFGKTTNDQKDTNPTQKEETTIKSSVLRKGDTGEEVKLLQKKLILLGYNLGNNGVDGNFGIKTYNAVVAFQKKYKLTVDGLVGAQTQTAISKALININIETTANLLNVRSGPGLSHKVIQTLKKGSTYKIIEEKEGWVKLDTLNGWVSLTYVKKHV